VTSLRAGLPWNFGSMPGRVRNLSLLENAMTAFGAHQFPMECEREAFSTYVKLPGSDAER